MTARPSFARLLLLRSASSVAVALLAGQVLAFARDAVLVYVFGASNDTDAFFVAMTVPDIVLQLTLAGATTSAMLPLLSRPNSLSPTEYRHRVVGTLLWFYLTFGGLILAAGWVAMPTIIRALAPGFPPSTEIKAVTLGRYLLPMPLFVSLAGVLTGLLNYHERFVLPALRFSIQSLTVSFGVLFLGERYGIRVAAVAASIGALLGLFSLLPNVLMILDNRIISLRPDWHILWHYMQLALPILGTAVLVQVVLVGEKVAASHFPPGSVASVVLARKIVFFAVAIGSQSLVTVIYPRLSQAASGFNWDEFRLRIRAAAIMIAGLMGAGGLVLWTLAHTVVSILLRRGAFDPSDADRVAHLLRCLAFGLPVFSLNSLLVQSFNARKDVLPPLLVGLATTSIYIVMLRLLPNALGLIAIPVSLVASDTVRLLVLMRIWTSRTPASH